MTGDTKIDTQLENVLHPLLVGGMIGCIALSLVDLIHLFAPDWNGMVVVAACLLAALEAHTSYRLVHTRFRTDRTRFRLVELATFWILLKVATTVGDGWSTVWADVRTWPRHPLHLFDAESSFAFLLTVLAWAASTRTTHDLRQIGQPVHSFKAYVPPTERLAQRFFAGGAALLLITGLTRVGLSALLDLERPPVPGLVLNVLAYYLMGLVMMGQTHATRLRRTWQREGIEVAGQLSQRWARYSLVFVGLVAFLAFLLPTHYTMGLLDTLAAAARILWQVAAFLFTLITLPLAWLVSLFVGTPPPALPPVEPQPAEPLTLQGPSPALPAWLGVLRSLVFWVVVLGTATYVLRSYFRDRPELLRDLARLRPIAIVRRWLSGLWRHLVGLAQAVRARLPEEIRSARSRRRRSTGPGRRFLRLGALSPRERIQYYFLSIVRRAGRRGVPRHAGQTPYEYGACLEPHLADASTEMEALTQAFVEARYSRRPFDREDDRRVRGFWERVRAAVRGLRDDRGDEGQT